MKKTCDKCKMYKSNEEFNCEFYKIVIFDLDMANKCKNFNDKSFRKRCNKCIHLIYTYVTNRKKYLYKCRRTGKVLTYTSLQQCEKFEEKKIE